MQPEMSHWAIIRRIAAKEVTLFFASPIAYLFLATFAAVTLFVFFWGEAFFSRNIADVRPLFEWMPILLIFLASTLTMRLWSEERRTGTLEHVLTLPASLWHFVLGKFVGCWLLLAIAVVMTLPLPLTVSIIGDLDWGPVWAGYLATLLLGAAYLSIGLFISARSDNQIVSLISAVAVCSLFYLIGSSTMTDLFGNQAGEWLRSMGTGSRFEAITRGVIDLRDLYYYLSMIAVFLVLNTYILERERWANIGQAPHHQRWRAVTLLLIANALGVNLWLGQMNTLRIDATQGNLYSLSSATEKYLGQLQEPLLVRGYFSGKTHPLLSPLVPQLRDLIQEYEIAGQGRVRVEFVDPISDPELEQEANQKYGIKPTPFQVADRYQSSIVSSYFNVLVQYGDAHEVLGFRDLIEVKARGEADLDVQLRNPEHDLTRAIKKVLHSYQAGGNLFDTVKGNLTFTGYVSSASVLPEQLVSFQQSIDKTLTALAGKANGRLQVTFVEPEADGGKVAAQIAEDYGFRPMTTDLLSQDQFYFYLILSKTTQGAAQQVIPIPLGDMSEGSFERNLKSAIKRFASGFTKTVALVAPAGNPAYAQYGMGGGAQYSQLKSFLGAELEMKTEDLSDGRVSGDADILLLLAPDNLDEQQLFAVDQFLMQGGTVIAATSPFQASFSDRRLSLKAQSSGLEDWLQHHGLNIEKKLVMDPQNAAFPIPVTRNIGGFQLQEIRMLDYPYFIDVRRQGLNQDHPITADLRQSTLAWASPIVVQAQPNGRKVTELVHSSTASWLSASTDIMPRINPNGATEYVPEGSQSAQLLGVISAGRFDSYFADKPSPLLIDPSADAESESDPQADAAADVTALAAEDSDATEETKMVVSGVIARSPESARIVLFSSNDFLRDQVIEMAGAAEGGEYLNTLQLLNNTIDWSIEDAGLLSIRARGHFNRTLPPMEHSTQLFWEYLNYALAVALLMLIGFLQHQRQQARLQTFRQLLAD